MRKNHGITLISLVVTVVVLLILAAISIGVLTGNNGILNQSILAKEDTEIAGEKETVEMSAAQAAGKDVYGNIVEENLREQLDINIGEGEYNLELVDDRFKITYIESNRSYLVDASGNVETVVIEEVVNREGLKVGDYINYIPDENTEGYTTDKLTYEITGSSGNKNAITQDQQYAKDGTGMAWQILRIYADGSMDLIGSPTNQQVVFGAANGYNNGVTIMNDICKKLYSRGTIKARNVNYEDIEYWLTDAGESVRDSYSDYSGGPIYGHTQTYTTNRFYPNLYSQEIGSKIDSGVSGLIEGIDKELGNVTGLIISEEGTANGYTEAGTSLTVTQTFWGGVINSANFGEGSDVLGFGGSYFIASRFVGCESDYTVFGFEVCARLCFYWIQYV